MIVVMVVVKIMWYLYIVIVGGEGFIVLSFFLVIFNI